MSIVLSQATIEDTRGLMEFMDKVWKKDHILSKDKELFLYEFQEENYLNIIIAKDEKESIVGIFGFIKYNSSSLPDIAGSLWKVDPNIKEPLLGLRLREYFVKNIPHRFFAAPGAGLQTKPIYKVLKMNWHRMKQYYIVNDTLSSFKVIQNPQIKKIEYLFNNNITIKKMQDINEIETFVFDTNIVPTKDIHYMKKRYLNHPIYSYDIYYLKKISTIVNIFVCRLVQVNDTKVYRIVDFFGDLEYLGSIASFCYKYIKDNSIEYIDFINHGLNEESLIQSGFSLLDFESNKTIVPNFFEPFLSQNVPVYCVSDKTEKEFRQFKADGDQDRPNQLQVMP